MNLKLTRGISLLFLSLALSLWTAGCSNSGKENTESNEQGTAAKTVSEPSSSATGSPIDTVRSESSVTVKTSTVGNTVTKQETSSSRTKETSTSKKESNPSLAISTTSITEKSKTTKTTIVNPPPVAANPKPAAEAKEEVKVAPPPPPPAPKPEPAVVEKPKEAVVAPPAKTVNPAASTWVAPASANSRSNPVKPNGESLSAGKELFDLHCASCHGKTGRGNGTKAAQLETPCGNFTFPAFKSQTDGSIFYKITQGKGDMPAFKKKITDEDEMWNLINYIRSLK